MSSPSIGVRPEHLRQALLEVELSNLQNKHRNKREAQLRKSVDDFIKINHLQTVPCKPANPPPREFIAKPDHLYGALSEIQQTNNRIQREARVRNFFQYSNKRNNLYSPFYPHINHAPLIPEQTLQNIRNLQSIAISNGIHQERLSSIQNDCADLFKREREIRVCLEEIRTQIDVVSQQHEEIQQLLHPLEDKDKQFKQIQEQLSEVQVERQEIAQAENNSMHRIQQAFDRLLQKEDKTEQPEGSISPSLQTCHNAQEKFAPMQQQDSSQLKIKEKKRNEISQEKIDNHSDHILNLAEKGDEFQSSLPKQSTDCAAIPVGTPAENTVSVPSEKTPPIREKDGSALPKSISKSAKELKISPSEKSPVGIAADCVTHTQQDPEITYQAESYSDETTLIEKILENPTPSHEKINHIRANFQDSQKIVLSSPQQRNKPLTKVTLHSSIFYSLINMFRTAMNWFTHLLGIYQK